MFWTPKQYKRAAIVEKTKPEYAKHFTYKPIIIIIIIIFFFSANFKKNNSKYTLESGEEEEEEEEEWEKNKCEFSKKN